MAGRRTPKYQRKTQTRAADLLEYLETGEKSPQQIHKHFADLSPWQIRHVFECAKDLTQSLKGQTIYWSPQEWVWRVTSDPLHKLDYDLWDADYMLTRSLRKSFGNKVLAPQASRELQRLFQRMDLITEEQEDFIAKLQELIES